MITVSSLVELVRELRAIVRTIDLNELKYTPTDSEVDAEVWEKFVEILKKLSAEEEVIPSPYDIASGESSDMPYTIVGESKDDEDDVDPTYYSPVVVEDDDPAESLADDTVEFDEVKVSDTAFPELFPTKEVTKKKDLPKSFPNIDEFDGGIHLLGSGNFGYTFKSILRGVPVVLKASKIRSEESNRADYHEWSVSEKLKPHPNVLQIIGLCPSFALPMFGSVGTTALIAPLQENGGLREFFDKRTPRDDDISDIAFGMIVGIRSLHEQRVVHRDIAVRNFLANCDGRVLLCDFGLAEFLPEGEDVFRGSPNEALPWRSLAPESLFDLEFSTKSDIWTYGLALLELVSKQMPWPNFRRCADLRSAFIKKEITLPDVQKFPPVIADVIRDCLQFEPSDRPSADEIAERLVKSQFEKDQHTREENGNTFLHRDRKGDLGVYLLMAHNRPMVNAVNIYGQTPLMLAKTKEWQTSLLAYRQVPPCNSEPSRIPEYFHNIDVFGSLIRFAMNEDVEGVKSLRGLQLRGALTKQHCEVGLWKGENPLHIASRKGNVALLDAFMELNIFDVSEANHDGQTTLHIAAIEGKADLIERLLRTEDVAEVNDRRNIPILCFVNIQDNKGKTALHLAARGGNVSATDTLLSSGSIDVNIRDQNGQSPMFECITETSNDQSGHMTVLESFLSNTSVSLNQTDFNGETIMHKIARKDLVQAARIVLQRADLKVSAQEREHGYSPLHVAVRELSAGVVQVLISRDDVDINEPDKHGYTPLHILAKLPALSGTNRGGASQKASAAKLGSNIANMLLACNNIRFNAITSSYESPLHCAVENNNKVLVKILLGHSEVDARAKASFGQTCLHFAAQNNCADIAELLVARCDVCARDFSQQTPLHYAARNNNIDVARILLSRNDVDVNARNNHGQTPLYWPVRWNMVAFVKLLLSRDDIDVNSYCDNTMLAQWTAPLHVAASHGRLEVVKLLLSTKHVNVNTRDETQRTPLHFAARKSHVEIVKLLLARDNIDADARDDSGKSPLTLAAHQNNIEVAKMLLARDDVATKNPFKFAAWGGYNKIIEMILSRDGVGPFAQDDEKETPLHCAAYCENAEFAKMILLRDGVGVNSRRADLKTPLHIAAWQNMFEVAELLLSRNDIEADARDHNQETPLHFVASFSKNKDDVAKLLLSRDDVQTNAAGFDLKTPLHYAAEKNNYEVAKLILAQNDVDAMARDKYEQTPLHYAAQNGSIEVAKLLMSRDDVDVSARNEKGQTPLHHAAGEILREVKDEDERIAVLKGKREVTEALLAIAGVHADARDKQQQTALHHAARTNNHDVAKLLLGRNDVDAMARDKYEQTPLHYAAQNGSIEVAMLLLSRDDVDASARSENGQTPLHRAAGEVSRELKMKDDRTAREEAERDMKATRVYRTVDVRAREKLKETALRHARDKQEVAKLLLARDVVNINACDVNDKTALHVAATHGAVKVAEALLSSNFNANARDKQQQTALHHAAHNDNHEVAKLLLARDDVDVDARDVNLKTPLDVAEEAGASECIELLRNFDRA